MSNSVSTDPEAFLLPGFLPNEKSGLLVAPLLISEQDEGWTLAIRRMAEPDFSAREFKLFQIFASYAEIAIENARLYEIALRETEALRRVNTIMRTVGSLESADQIYSRIANEIRLVFDYDRLIIAEVKTEKDRLKVVFDSGEDDWHFEQNQNTLSGSAAEQTIKTGQYFLRNDLTNISGPTYTYDEYLLSHNIGSYAIFPLRHEGRVKRVMLVAVRQPNAFDTAQLNFLEILAGQLTVTAENVHLFERLLRTRRQWQITLDSIPDAVLLLNAADLKILQINQAAAILATCRPDELIGQPYQGIFYQVDPCLCHFPLEQLQKPGSEFTEEASGTFSGRIYQRSIYPIFDNAGHLSEVVTHIREVTATKMMEQQLAQTVRLKAVGEMAAGIAHDFNNSLASILGNVELMLLENSNPQMRTQLVQLKQAALDGAETVRRVQSFGRKDGRKTYLKFELNNVIREVVELTRPRWQNQAQQQGIYVGMVLQLNNQLTIFGNPAEIKEAITNLVFNALDAMPKGGTLTLSTRREQVNSEVFAVLQIADSGQGIPEQHLTKIFDPFFTTKGLKGTGLGLSMARQIMAEHEGEIGFESVSGEGTTFYLRFPLVVPDRTLPDTPGEVLPIKNVASVSGSHSRILVIDDDRTLCQVLRRILEHYGHKVDLAEGGKQGLEIFQSRLGEFDIVFTDLSMPEMSGYEVARLIKNLDSAIIIILMTGWGADLSEETLTTRGIDLHIAKPYRITDVQKLLEKAHELRKAKLNGFVPSQDLL
jgi:signal transduction histidine kinase/ActR/RegA family two-component response regulator